MALTRKFLKSLGIDEDKIESIIEGHTESINSLQTKLDEKETSLNDLQKALDESKNAVSPYKEKYETTEKAFKDFKDSLDKQKLLESKNQAFKEILKACNIDEKRYDSILKITDLSTKELVDGKFKDVDEIKSDIEKNWADFKVKTIIKGQDVTTPPDKHTTFTKDQIKAMTPEEINKNWDNIKTNLKTLN